MTWRGDDELLARVKQAAQHLGRSMNDYVTALLDAATNPDLVGDEAARLRERLALAGLLAPAGPPRQRPDPKKVAQARVRAGRGTPLSTLVSQDR